LDDCKLYKHVRLEFCGKYFSNLPVIVKLAADNTILTEFYLFVPTSSAFFKFSPEDFESRLLTVLYLIYCSIDEDDSKEFHCLKGLYFDHNFLPLYQQVSFNC